MTSDAETVPAGLDAVSAGGDAEAGLSEAAALHRRREVGPNVLPEPRPPRVVSRVLVQLRDPMVALLILAAGIAVALRDAADAVVIALVVVLNTAVGVAQELRAEHALAALRRMSAPAARVVRDGRARTCAAADLVPGDLVRIEAGDVVPADLRLVTGNHLQIDEAALTGESVPVDKRPAPADAAPEAATAYAGTVVTRGRGAGIVTATGSASHLGRIAAMLAAAPPRPTPLQARLSALGRVLALVAVALSTLVLISGLIRGRPLAEMLLTAMSLAVAAVPESLPAVVTLALALGARRMARRAAVVRRLQAVETLGSVTVIAADKTGTLTENRMYAERVWTPAGDYVAAGSAYDPHGELRAAGPLAPGAADALHALLVAAVLCNDAELEQVAGEPGEAARVGDGSASWRPVGDPTEAALLVAAAKGGVSWRAARAAHPRTAEIPFDSARKFMTTAHATAAAGQHLVVTKGAPEVLLADGGPLPAGPARDAARRWAARLAADGYRVLAVAQRVTSLPGSDPAATAATLAAGSMHLLGVVAITDPPRANAAAVVESVRNAGVDLLLITGDHPDTARAIARRVGFDGEPVTGADLEAGLAAEDLAAARVFARTRPEQKLDIVRAWQELGHVVAMTGDGVNDGPALRRADIGVAMGRGGTEVARQAADLVLTDDDLGTVVEAIAEGRRIYANVRTFLRYALAGGLAEVAVMLLGPLVGLAVPLLPAQILWINMLTHGLPGVALGSEPAEPEAMRARPRSPREFVLGGGLWRRIAWTGAVIAAVTLAVGAWSHAAGRPWQTTTFLVLGLAQLGVALALRQRTAPRQSRHWRPRFLDVAVAAAVLLQIAGVWWPPLQALLGTQALGGVDVLVAASAASLPGLVVALVQRRAKA